MDRGTDYELGDVFGMLDKVFTVTSVERNGRGWSHVLGQSE